MRNRAQSINNNQGNMAINKQTTNQIKVLRLIVDDGVELSDMMELDFQR
ncbi:MAG TPA: hypothetical protein PLJ60_05315 [Chryseolinea sp.]|nr:hypothetical protein [Chryseolinea sp.]HPH45708.1 hypothetical protein [Chryseolinea sp.]HPM29738.1 hypothetical protein [Chryseolinea sp.]